MHPRYNPNGPIMPNNPNHPHITNIPNYPNNPNNPNITNNSRILTSVITLIIITCLNPYLADCRGYLAMGI